jgi:hypothetical protein
MLASFPASMLNQNRSDLGILNRFSLNPSRSSTSAEALLDRMLNKIDDLCAERDRLKKEQPGHNKGKVVGGRRW